MKRIFRLLRQLFWEPAEPLRGRCPVCDREIILDRNNIGHGNGGGLRIPRPLEEYIGACQRQNHVQHESAEIAAVRAERGAWI